MTDIDNFVVGLNDKSIVPPLEVDLPKTIEYLKKTDKNFNELTPDEIERLKPS